MIDWRSNDRVRAFLLAILDRTDARVRDSGLDIDAMLRVLRLLIELQENPDKIRHLDDNKISNILAIATNGVARYMVARIESEGGEQ